MAPGQVPRSRLPSQQGKGSIRTDSPHCQIFSQSYVCANFAHTTLHGAIKGKSQTHDVVYYNLDVIISVGYRVKSKRGTQFRIWANKILKEYLIKGYAINERIKLDHYQELKQVVHVLASTLKNQEQLTSEQSKGQNKFSPCIQAKHIIFY